MNDNNTAVAILVAILILTQVLILRVFIKEKKQVYNILANHTTAIRGLMEKK